MPGLLRGVARTAVIAGTPRPSQPREPAPRPTSGPRRRSRRAHRSSSTPRHRRRPAERTGSGSSRTWAPCKEQGVLTEEEFAAEKARILAD